MSPNRACAACHRMKIRCVGKSSPPCQRCRRLGLDCSFDHDTPAVRLPKSRDDRLSTVEAQVGNLQGAVLRMEGMLRQALHGSAQVSNHMETTSFAQSAESGLISEPTDQDHTRPPLPSTLQDWVQNPELQIVARTSSPSTLSHGREEPDVNERNVDARSEEDVLLTDAAIGGTMRDMLYRDEEERLRLERAPSLSNGFGAVSAPNSPLDPTGTSGPSRTRNDVPLPARRGDALSSFPDPVDLGYCTETEGKYLFEMFYTGVHSFLPIFDREYDTWTSLRRRSTFCITTILMASQIAASVDGSSSSLRSKLVAHAERIALATLFSPVANIEAVQAMLILACWGDTAWRPGNHALSVAMDMDLHLCMPYLARTGMGKNKSAAELEKERPLLAGARVWLAACKTHIETCQNYGRPFLISPEEAIRFGREFVFHPLATIEDTRHVALLETHAIRAPFQRAVHDPTGRHEAESLIQQVMAGMDIWEAYWLDHYAQRGFGADHFMVTEITTVKLYNRMQVNAAVLQGLRSRQDVQALSSDKRRCLEICLSAAAALVARAARGAENAKIRYGNRNVRLGLALAARYLVRLSSLLPEGVDLRQAGKDVEKLADELSKFPDFHFSKFLHRVVVEARQRHELPPRSRRPSLEPGPPQPTTTVQGLDFSIAEALFASEDWLSTLGQGGSSDLQAESSTNATFFPFDDQMFSLPAASDDQNTSETVWDASKRPFWLE